MRLLPMETCKKQVYQLSTAQSLREEISEAIKKVDKSGFGCSGEGLKYRFDVCRVTNGTHVENPQKKFMSFHAVISCFYQ
jgi:hypothetical protein